MFSVWMVGFLLLMALLVWLAVVLGLPQPYIGGAVLILLLLGIGVTAWVRRRRRQR